MIFHPPGGKIDALETGFVEGLAEAVEDDWELFTLSEMGRLL